MTADFVVLTIRLELYYKENLATQGENLTVLVNQVIKAPNEIFHTDVMVSISVAGG